MDALTFRRVAEMVRARPYLSESPAEMFEAAAHDHETPSTGCTGGPHCWVEMQARGVLQLTGGA